MNSTFYYPKSITYIVHVNMTKISLRYFPTVHDFTCIILDINGGGDFHLSLVIPAGLISYHLLS